MSKELTGKGAMLDSVVKNKRNTGSRAMLGISVVLIVAGLSFSLGSLFGTVGIILSIALTGVLVAAIVPYFTVYVPYTWGLVTENSFSGEPVVYGAGWHWSYPWEQATEDSNISLEERTSIHEGLSIASKTDEMKVKVSFQWRPNLAHLATFRRMDESTVNQGIFEPLERFISTLFAVMNAEEVRKNQSILSNLAYKAFKNASVESEVARDNPLHDTLLQELAQFRARAKDLEASFGIYVVQVNISDVDFSEDVKKARAAKAEHVPLMELYHQLAGGKERYESLPFELQSKLREEARVLSGNATEHQLKIS